MNLWGSHLTRASITLLPVAALLLVGLLALPHLDPHALRFLLLLLGISLIGVVLGELLLRWCLQRLQRRRYQALINACQQTLLGETNQRPHMQGDRSLLPLARQLNSQLDTILLAQKHSQQQQGAILRHQREHDTLQTQLQQAQMAHAQLITQIHHLLLALNPVLQGDLRVRAERVPGEVGRLADLCNALVEETSKHVSWTRSSSQQLTLQSHALLTSAIILAGQVEDQLQHSAQMTEMTEQMMTCLHYVRTTLQLSLDNMSALHNQWQPHHSLTLDAGNLFHQVEQTTRAHLHLLTELLQTTRTPTGLAATLMQQSTTFAQGLHQSSVGVLQAAEQLTTVAWLAEQRAEEVRTFQLPEVPTPPLPLPAASTPPPAAASKPPSTATCSPRLAPESPQEPFHAHLV